MTSGSEIKYSYSPYSISRIRLNKFKKNNCHLNQEVVSYNLIIDLIKIDLKLDMQLKNLYFELSKHSLCKIKFDNTFQRELLQSKKWSKQIIVLKNYY